jgi:outer membrane biogenesis lipoprotein LolB
MHTGTRSIGLLLLITALLGALLAGCASPPPLPTSADREARLWTGRFAARFPDPQSATGQGQANGRFRIENLPGGTILLELSSPLGQLIARARVAPDRAELEDARGDIHRAASDEQLTETLFGWPIPVRALPRWLNGRIDRANDADAPIQPQSTSDPADRSRDWRVRRSGGMPDRPRMLELNFPGAEPDASRRINLRLVIESAR